MCAYCGLVIYIYMYVKGSVCVCSHNYQVYISIIMINPHVGLICRNRGIQFLQKGTVQNENII